MINSHYNFLSTVLCKGIRQSSNQFSNMKQVTIYQFSIRNLHLPSIVCYVTRQSFRIFSKYIDFRFFRCHCRTQRDDHFANRPSVLNLHFRNANVSTQRVNDLEDHDLEDLEIQNSLNAKKYQKMLKFKRSNYQKTDQLLCW